MRACLQAPAVLRVANLQKKIAQIVLIDNVLGDPAKLLHGLGVEMDFDLQGNIEKFTLPEIFQLVSAGRKSGTLGIQKDDSIVMVYFESGDVTYGYGPRQTFHLGQLLRQKNIITAEQLDEAVAIQARTENGKRLGAILVEKRFIDRADLESVIRAQVEELLYSLLSWQSGSFKFYENQFPTDEEITVRLSTENVILEGLRRLDEQQLIAETLPDLKAIYTITAAQSGRPRSVTLSADEWNLMALVNNQRSLEQIIALSSLPEERTVRLLAQLKLAGLIVSTGETVSSLPTAGANGSATYASGTGANGRSTQAATSLSPMVNRLAGLLEDYLKAKQPNPAEPTNRISALKELS